VLSILYTKLR